MKSFLVCLLLSLSFSAIHASPSKWTLKQDMQGIRIYQQPSSQGHAITRGMTEMQTSLDSILSLMRDSNACSRWLHSCKSNQIIRQDSPLKRLDYTVVDSPFWFADRDMYIYSTSEYDKGTKTLTIRNSGRENFDKGQPNRVRIKSIQGFWQLKQISPDKISVLYQLSSNPQLVNSSFLDAYVAESVFYTLRNLNSVSKTPPYKNAMLPELRH